ncbi:MAG: FmdB family transcriptional regulator [Actinobacteria bacterium]|nr:FmdB family transcriptional regulator [Actinomycetota bacterium]
MPTYVYKFIDSGETIEIYQAFSEEALNEAPHPSDGKMRKVKKVFTPVGITFKGGGFYKTDSGSQATTSPKSETSSTSTTDASDTSTTSASTEKSSSSTSTTTPASTTNTSTPTTPAKSE